VTPAVVVTGLVMAGLVLLGVVGAMTYLTALGRDPDPVLRLAMEALGTVALVANLLLTLAGRAGQAKVERNTGLLGAKAGRLEAVVAETLDELDARGRHHSAPSDATELHGPVLPPVPDATRPHPLYGGHGAAPAPGGR
jgi:hypothetical protein